MLVDKQMLALPYYHGLLPREDIRLLLKRPGDYLLRTSEPRPGEPWTIILSLLGNDGIKHFVVKPYEHGYRIGRESYPDIRTLIATHHEKPMSDKVNSTLKTPVLRQLWELGHEDIEVTKKLGEGAFGEVSKGKLTKPDRSRVDVALKLAKMENLTKEQIKEIMREARFMRVMDHPNIVKLYGVAAGQEPLIIVMELADKGALDSYLQKNQVSRDLKLEMCAQAAFGIHYLHAKLFIHRDIAARNCLYGDRVKISDFGMTRYGPTYKMAAKTRVPIRWLSPETIMTFSYSYKTDVFSYGILCWEIIHNGADPYPGMAVAEVAARVREGYVMSLPENYPGEFRAIIAKCWERDPDNRYSSLQVATKIAAVTKTTMPPITYSYADVERFWYRSHASPDDGPGGPGAFTSKMLSVKSNMGKSIIQ